jgi:hypothetical protein
MTRKEKVTLVLEMVIESGFADTGGNANVAGRRGTVSFFKEKSHGDIENVVLLKTLFFHSLFPLEQLHDCWAI